MLIVFYLLEYRSLDIRKSLLLCLGPKDFHVNSIFGQAKVDHFEPPTGAHRNSSFKTMKRLHRA